MIRRPPRSTLSSSSAASDVYKRQGFGNPNAGYKSGTAHIHGFAILGEDDGSRTLKIAYSSIAGSCWDNKSAQISKTEAMAGKNEADKIVRSLRISGSKTGRPVSAAANTPTQN